MAFLGVKQDQFPQYSNAIADSSYQFDFCKRVTIAAGGNTLVTFPTQTQVVRAREIVMEDVTASTGGTAPANIACYYRIDGSTAGPGSLGDGSSSRILKPGENRKLNRFNAQENGITINNPNAAAVVIQVELAA